MKNIELKNTIYDSSKRAWMMDSIFKTWLNNLNKKMKQEGRKILLLIDNCSAHKIDSEYSNVEVMLLPKNTTGILQRLDRGIIQNFKLFFNRFKLTHIINKIERKIDVYTAYKKPSVKDAITFTELAWNEVKQTTIYNCFEHLIKKTNNESTEIDKNEEYENDSEYKTLI